MARVPPTFKKAKNNFCTIEPIFAVKDAAAAAPIMADFAKRTKKEPGCLFYGFAVAGDAMVCREAYVNGDAVNAHLKNVGPCIEALLASSCDLAEIKITGPAAEIEKTKPGTKDLGTLYYETAHGGVANVYHA